MKLLINNNSFPWVDRTHNRRFTVTPRSPCATTASLKIIICLYICFCYYTTETHCTDKSTGIRKLEFSIGKVVVTMDFAKFLRDFPYYVLKSTHPMMWEKNIRRYLFISDMQLLVEYFYTKLLWIWISIIVCKSVSFKLFPFALFNSRRC